MKPKAETKKHRTAVKSSAGKAVKPAEEERPLKGVEKRILVTGATGHQGGAVVNSLLETGGFKVRALVRDPDKPSARSLKAKGVELVKGDLDDRASIDRAFKDVYGVFSVETFVEKGVDGEIRQGRLIADASKDAGVKHFIYSSVGGADRKTGIPHFESKWQIEEHIRAIGLPATILRPVFFMYNFSAPQVQSAIMNGTLSYPIKPDRRMQMLAVEDLGHFVGLCFREPDTYIGKAIELAGDELTMPEAAEVFSKVIGRTVRYAEQPLEEVSRFSRDFGLMFKWFNENAYNADLPALRRLHPGLMSLETWLRKTRWAKKAA